jgi:membrane protein DedA with SNARE-associated domain
MSELEYPPFALFAYAGAALWAGTFIGLGYLLGERWKSVQDNIHNYFLGFTILCLIIGLSYLAWRKWGRSGSDDRPKGPDQV